MNGAHHANEYITSCVLERFIREFPPACRKGAEIGGLSARDTACAVTFCIVPKVNPDGVALVTGRATARETACAQKIAAAFPDVPFPRGWKANLRGVDLNLNYPADWNEAVKVKAAKGFDRPAPRDFPGPCPLSEPETKAMACLTRRFDPHMTLSLHTQGREIYWKYGPLEPAHSREMAQRMAKASGYAATETPWESDRAGYKDWFIAKWNRPGFTVESGLGESPLPLSDLDQIYGEFLSLLAAALDSYPKVKES